MRLGFVMRLSLMLFWFVIQSLELTVFIYVQVIFNHLIN